MPTLYFIVVTGGPRLRRGRRGDESTGQGGGGKQANEHEILGVVGRREHLRSAGRGPALAAGKSRGRPRDGHPSTSRRPGRGRGGVGRAVSRVLYPVARGWSSVWDGRRRPPRAAYPRFTVAGGIGAGRTSPLIWPCSDWGLPCRRCYQRRGGLLPHHFTLTLRRLRTLGRFAFCCPVRRLAAPRRYLAVCPVELGLSSDAEAPATIEPGPPPI